MDNFRVHYGYCFTPLIHEMTARTMTATDIPVCYSCARGYVKWARSGVPANNLDRQKIDCTELDQGAPGRQYHGTGKLSSAAYADIRVTPTVTVM